MHDADYDDEQQPNTLDTVPRRHSPFHPTSENRLRSHRKAVYYEEAPFIDDDIQQEEDTPLELGTSDIPKANLNVEHSSPSSQTSSIAPPEAYGLPPGWQVAYGKLISVFKVLDNQRVLISQ